MSLPPLSNIFAVYDENPESLNKIKQKLKVSNQFLHIRTPIKNWLVANSPLPESIPDNNVIFNYGFVFSEGRDVLIDDTGKEPEEQLRKISNIINTNPTKLDILPGDFGFIYFDKNGKVTVVRSCGGVAPFYIGQFKNRLVISTLYTDIVRYIPEEFKIDPLVNAIHSCSFLIFPDNRTLLKDVLYLKRGFFAQIENGKITNYDRYWDPRPDKLIFPDKQIQQENAIRLKEILLKNLEKNLDPKGRNLLALSGGVDSSALAALSSGALGYSISTISFLPTKDKEKDVYQHEISFIDNLANLYNFKDRWELYAPTSVIDLFKGAPFLAFHIVHPVLCSLATVNKETEIKVYFGGEYADNVCGSVFTLPDWSLHTPVFEIFKPAYMKSPKIIAKYFLHKIKQIQKKPVIFMPDILLELDLFNPKRELGMFTKEIKDEFLSWYKTQEKTILQDEKPWPHLWLDLNEIAATWVDMNWEVASFFGIRRLTPFFNRDIFELVFNTHPVEHYGPGTKKFLRNALNGLVPENNLFRKDKGSFLRGRRKFLSNYKLPMPNDSLPEELRELLLPEWFSNPPKEVYYQQARVLFRLTRFIKNIDINKNINYINTNWKENLIPNVKLPIKKRR